VETLRKVRDIGLSSALALRKLRNRKPLFSCPGKGFRGVAKHVPLIPVLQGRPKVYAVFARVRLFSDARA
jgi:hypothetical protein